MAILNGSYKFHTSPTTYTGDYWYFSVVFMDNAGTKYNGIESNYNVSTMGATTAGKLVPFFDTVDPLLNNQDMVTTTFDDVENAPWLILTFDNQVVGNTLYEIITNCADPYFDGISINITSPEGVTLATEKTIVNSNIKIEVGDVYDAGKQAEYDAFWDEYQRTGNYTGAFAGYGWSAQTLKPKKDINANEASYMFYYNRVLPTDLVAFFNGLGITLSFEQCRNANSIFQYSNFARVGKIYCSTASWHSTFYGCTNLVTIDEWGEINGGDIAGGLSGTFTNCTSLENITVVGNIAQSLNMQWCPLTHDSLMSVINHLKDYSASGGSYTLTIGAANVAKLTSDELLIAENKGWDVI